MATLRPVMTPAMAISFCGSDWPRRKTLRLGLHLAGGRGVDDFHVAELFAVLVERVAGDEEAEDLLFVLEAGVLVPVGGGGRASSACVEAAGPSSSKMPKRPCWPAAASRCDFWARSMALSRAAQSWARRPKASMAPALMSDSSTRLLSRRRSTFSQNSQRRGEARLPFRLQSGRARRGWTRWRCGRRS